MKLIRFLKAYLIVLKFKFSWFKLLDTKFPKIWYCGTIKKYIVFCPYCGEYICEDGICSNPICPELIHDEDEGNN